MLLDYKSMSLSPPLSTVYDSCIFCASAHAMSFEVAGVHVNVVRLAVRRSINRVHMDGTDVLHYSY